MLVAPNGRQIIAARGRMLGAAVSGPYAQASTDLQNQVAGPVGAGDTYLAEGDYPSAVQAYQAAGQAGATSVGPEIDEVGAPNVTQPYTQQAWQWKAMAGGADGSEHQIGRVVACAVV